MKLYRNQCLTCDWSNLINLIRVPNTLHSNGCLKQNSRFPTIGRRKIQLRKIKNYTYTINDNVTP